MTAEHGFAKERSRFGSLIGPGVTSALLGIAAIGATGAASHRPSSSLLHWVRDGIEGYGPLAVLLLMGVGWFVRRRWVVSPLFIALCTVAALPLVTVAEVIVEPTSHNLWPFEVLLYAFIAGPGLVGAYIAAKQRPLENPSGG